MRTVRAIWDFITHPALSALGNVTLLIASIPFVIVIAGGVVGGVLDQPILSVLAIGLGVLGLIWLMAAAINQRRWGNRTEGTKDRPQGSRVAAGDRRSAPRDVPGRTYGAGAIGAAARQDKEQRDKEAIFIAVEAEVALACEEAQEMAKMLRADWPHITPTGAVVEIALPDWRAKTLDFIGTVLGSAQRAAFKGSAKGDNTLEALESEGEFLEQLALNIAPAAIRVEEAGLLAARATRRGHESASFLSYNHARSPDAPPPDDLTDGLDALMRDGIELVDELSESVQPEKVKGGWKLSGGDAPDEWWKKADSFTKRVRELLVERHPALLTDYRDGFNGYLANESDTREAIDPTEDKRSDAEKMRDFANSERSGPREVIEASLEGLSAARHQLA